MNSNVKTDNRTILGYAMAMVLACVLVASNARAGDPPRSETVKFADLNLDTSAGVEALYGRIHRAAIHVCSNAEDFAEGTRACMKDAESRAIGKVNSPLLTAFYEKKTGRTPQAVVASR
jgi:UrcA family protein